MDNEKVYDACHDDPSSLDYEYEEVFGAAEAVTEGVLLACPDIQNQGERLKSRMGCTRYGLVHGANAVNYAAASTGAKEYDPIDAFEMWSRYVDVEVQAERVGATLQSALDQARKEGIISGYAKLLTVEQVEASIEAFRPVYTGSLNGDWSHVLTEKVYRERTDGRTAGHAFVIVGFDRKNRVFIAVNSYGRENGYFRIPYSLLGTLYSKYSLVDAKDEKLIYDYRNRIMEGISIEDAKKAFEENVWNGLNPKEPATREEVAAMIYRAMEALKSE